MNKVCLASIVTLMTGLLTLPAYADVKLAVVDMQVVLQKAPQIAKINVINGGQGYSSAPTITITGGGGNGASAVATVVATFAAGTGTTAKGLRRHSETRRRWLPIADKRRTSHRHFEILEGKC